jgi:hypothetical protein
MAAQHRLGQLQHPDHLFSDNGSLTRDASQRALVQVEQTAIETYLPPTTGKLRWASLTRQRDWRVLPSQSLSECAAVRCSAVFENEVAECLS